MTLEQQLRSAVESLEVTPPPGWAERAARGGRRRVYRRRAVISGAGLIGGTAVGLPFLLRGPSSAVVDYSASTTAYIQNGVAFSVPKQLLLLSTSDRGMTFDDGDGTIVVRVTRFEIDPYFAPTPIMKDLGHRALFRVSGVDRPMMEQIAATAVDLFDGNAVMIDGLRMPVPRGFFVTRVTGPDASADTRYASRRTTIRLCRTPGDATDPHADGCILVVLHHTRYESDVIVDFAATGTSVGPHGVVTGHAGRVGSRRDVASVQVTAYGVPRATVEALVHNFGYA